MGNELEMQTGYILYVDILGYTNIIKSNNEDDEMKLKLFLKKLQREKLPLDNLFDNCNVNLFNIRYFSDNIFIFYESDKRNKNVFLGMCHIANYIQSLGISLGFMTRGSLSYGTIEYNETILFGASLVNSVEYEKYNLSPSVCLSPDLKEFAMRTFSNTTEDYLNPFAYFHSTDDDAKLQCLSGIGVLVERLNKQKIVDDNIIKKYDWLINEYNRYFKLKIKKKIIRLPSAIYSIVDDINVGVWA